MDISSQDAGSGSEPNALWSVLFTSSQEQHAPTSESEPQQQSLPHQTQQQNIVVAELGVQLGEPKLPLADSPDLNKDVIAAGKDPVNEELEAPTVALMSDLDTDTGAVPSHRDVVPAPAPALLSEPSTLNLTGIAHVEAHDPDPAGIGNNVEFWPGVACAVANVAEMDANPAKVQNEKASHNDSQAAAGLNLPEGTEMAEDNVMAATAPSPRAAIAVQQTFPAPYKQEQEHIVFEESLEDELDGVMVPVNRSSDIGSTTGRNVLPDGEQINGDGGGGRRLKRLRRSQHYTPMVDGDGVASVNITTGGDLPAPIGAGGGREERLTKVLRKRVVVRSALDEDLDDQPPSAATEEWRSGGPSTKRASGAATAKGVEDAYPGKPEGEEDPDEEEEDVKAEAQEDPEVAKQRILREAALRDRVGGRAVVDLPVRPLTDVLSRIMARQKSLVERTRANDPVSQGQQAAAAQHAQPAVPPTFNVRALMQSLAQNKQQPQLPAGTCRREGGVSSAGAAPVTGKAAAASTCATGRGEEPSQMDLDLRLHGGEEEGLDLPAVTDGSGQQQEQKDGLTGARNTVTADASAAATVCGDDGSCDMDSELVVEEEQACHPAKSPFAAIRGLRPLDVASGALPCDTQALMYDEASQPQQTDQASQQQKQEQTQSDDPQKNPRGATKTVIQLVDLAHRVPSIQTRSGSGSAGAEGSQDASGLILDIMTPDLDLGEEDDLIVEPEPMVENPEQQHAGKTASAVARAAESDGNTENRGHDISGDKEEAVDADVIGDEDEEEEEAAVEEEEEEAGEEEAEGEEVEEDDGEAGEGEEAEEDDGEAGEGEEEARAGVEGEEEEAGEEEGLVYDVDEEFDSTDEEDALEPEALHFEEEEADTAAGTGLLDGGDQQASGVDPTDATALERRRQLTDVLIAEAMKRRAEQLAEAKRRAAAERGAGAFFVDVEAELSDDEEGIAALDDLEDEYDGEDLDEGILASLLGTARDSAVDEARRVELHAMWETERDSAAVRELLEAVRRGFRRTRRKNGLGGLDDDDMTDNDARRRRANLFSSTVGDDDDAPVKVARGHGLDLDLAREDDEDVDALPQPESGSAQGAATQDDSQAAEGGVGVGGGGALPTLAARAGARFPLGRSAHGFGFSGNSISRILDPVEAKRLLRQQSQEAAVAAARRQEDGAGDTSPGNSLEPSPLRGGSGTAAAAAVQQSDDVIALLQRSASAAAGFTGLGAGAEPAAVGDAGGVAHKFTLFGSDITNRTGGSGAGGTGDRFQGGLAGATFLGRSAAPTSLRTASNTAAGINTRSYIFATDASNSAFPEKSRDVTAAATVDGGGSSAAATVESGAGRGNGGGLTAGVTSFAAIRAVLAQPPRCGGGEGSGGGLMGLLGLGSSGGANGSAAGSSGSTGRGAGGSALDLKRKLVVGGMPANKKRV